VGKGNDDALDIVVLSAVGHYAAQVPGAIPPLDLANDRLRDTQDQSGIVQKGLVGSQRTEVRQRPADIARDDVEEQPGGRGEEANTEARIEEDRRDVGAVENILQVVGGGALAFERFLELAVEG